MAGGPFKPSSAVPIGTSGEVFPNFHSGDGANAAVEEEGLGVANATDLTADRGFSLRFEMPTTLPTGTATFRLFALADIQAGDLSVDPTWASVAMDEDPSAASLIAEGPDPDSRTGGDGSGNATFGWASTDDDVYIEARWTLNADTVVAGEVIVMHLRIDDGDTTVAAVATLFPSVIFVTRIAHTEFNIIGRRGC